MIPLLEAAATNSQAPPGNNSMHSILFFYRNISLARNKKNL